MRIGREPLEFAEGEGGVSFRKSPTRVGSYETVAVFPYGGWSGLHDFARFPLWAFEVMAIEREVDEAARIILVEYIDLQVGADVSTSATSHLLSLAHHLANLSLALEPDRAHGPDGVSGE